MDTLALSSGDLVLSAGGYATYSGADRIRQDITLALSEMYGGDRMHPRWGSILEQFIGQPMTAGMVAAVTNEVRRVLGNYLAVQGDLIATGARARSRFNTGDVVSSIASIDVLPSADRITVTVGLVTVNGSVVTVSRTMS